MAKKWRPLPKRITPKTLQAITELAERGHNKQSISRQLNLQPNDLHRIKETDKAFLDGRDRLADKICTECVESGDYRDRALIANKMNLFSSEVEVPEITDIPSLLQAQGFMLQAFALGRINAETLTAFTKSSSTLSQGYFDSDIKRQLDDLQHQLKHKADKTEDFK